MNHVARDSFGDLDAAADDPHVVECAQCGAALADQQEVRAALTRQPDPGPMPDDVTERLLGALGALPALPAADHGAGPGTVVPLDVERVRRRPRRPWLAAAAAVLALGAGGYVVRGMAPEGHSASSAGAALEPRVGPAPDARGLSSGPVVSTGTSYTRGRLAQQVDDVLTHRAGPFSGAAVDGAAIDGAVSVAQCLRAIGATDATPLIADVASFDGAPALVLVLRTRAGVREVWVVARSCRPGQDGLRYYQQLG